jgi:adenosylcobinamide kinase / adenosylcobinamide-phosphate guanylyltransferase
VSPGVEQGSKSVTLVLGGARSGKSFYAQELAGAFERVSFMATGRATDAEMRKKIKRHRRERPASWKTIEAPVELAEAIRRESHKTDVIIVDCLTVYAANVMGGARKKAKTDLEECIKGVCEAIRDSKASVIAVSNEVGSGVVPPYRSGRAYRDFLGQLNQRVAQIADRVVLMIAGLPMTVKDSQIAQRGDDVRSEGAVARQPSRSANGGCKRTSRLQETLR